MIEMDKDTENMVREVLSKMKNKVSVKVSGEAPMEIMEKIKSLAPEGLVEIEKIEGNEPKVVLKKNVVFMGTPSGYEFQTIVEDIVDLSNGPEVPEDIKKRLEKIDKPVEIVVLVTPQCPYCPVSARLSHIFAMVNDKINSTVYEVQEFPEIIKKYNVMAVPKTIINGKVEFEGAFPAGPLLDKIEEALKD